MQQDWIFYKFGINNNQTFISEILTVLTIVPWEKSSYFSIPWYLRLKATLTTKPSK